MKLKDIQNIEICTISKIVDEIIFAVIFNDFYRPKFYEFNQDNSQILKDKQFSTFKEYKDFILPKILYELINTKWSSKNYYNNKNKILNMFGDFIPIISVSDGYFGERINEILRKYDFIPIDVSENEWVSDNESNNANS